MKGGGDGGRERKMEGSDSVKRMGSKGVGE